MKLSDKNGARNNAISEKWPKETRKIYFKKCRFSKLCSQSRKLYRNHFQELVDSNSMSKEMRKSMKPVGNRLATMYWLWKNVYLV